MKNLIAFIPARGGSKGIPNKNIIDLGGLPLLAHTILAAKVENIHSVIVSSDDEKILETAKKYNAIPLKRPIELAGDESPTAHAIDHMLETFDWRGSGVDGIVLMQATSPFRTTEHLKEAVALYNTDPTFTIISVSEYDVSPYRGYIIEKNKELKSIFGNEHLYARRQDMPKAFAANGAIYIFSIEKYLEDKNIPNNKVKGFEMIQPFDLDIDTPIDLAFAQSLIEKKMVKVNSNNN